MSLRRAVEQRSGPVLVLLSRQARPVFPLLAAALLLLGLFLPGLLGAAFLVALLVLVGWLSYLSWPVLLPPARAVRVALLVLLAVAALTK